LASELAMSCSNCVDCGSTWTVGILLYLDTRPPVGKVMSS
jgi:hypothetical protein